MGRDGERWRCVRDSRHASMIACVPPMREYVASILLVGENQQGQADEILVVQEVLQHGGVLRQFVVVRGVNDKSNCLRFAIVRWPVMANRCPTAKVPQFQLLRGAAERERAH
eukprot:CAMPEP_0115847958 /NCGR_PEP_ID=MMETSP0287-20121206/10663_1 /TAXON_ID=412157 /ORGANISM="Chrysochromulina rotalis, Strain UIO044" /LENGTH=111 /DNA_ID=CAMNT_0003301833 /DNA_START=880 /DNA_END=1216 /DNA_ORIENTATION=-